MLPIYTHMTTKTNSASMKQSNSSATQATSSSKQAASKQAIKPVKNVKYISLETHKGLCELNQASKAIMRSCGHCLTALQMLRLEPAAQELIKKLRKGEGFKKFEAESMTKYKGMTTGKHSPYSCLKAIKAILYPKLAKKVK